jgi:ankyrin repeat protein
MLYFTTDRSDPYRSVVDALVMNLATSYYKEACRKGQWRFRCLTARSDFIENQNFALICQIILKLSLQGFEEEILRNLDDVDIPDVMGRTALEWAAARGDE